MPINLEQLRQIAEGKRNAPLVAAVRVSVTTAIRLGGVEALDPMGDEVAFRLRELW